MKYLLKLSVLAASASAFTFKNGPGSSMAKGGHIEQYIPVIELSEDRINAEVGVNSSALTPYMRETISNASSSVASGREIFKKRQTVTPGAGAVTCTSTSPCVDGSCCGSVRIPKLLLLSIQVL